MKDTVLKKEFSKKDVHRLRNIIKGKSGERTSKGIGYTKKQEFHKEGDIWEENSRTWTIRDGIKENITKLDKFKKATVPLFCPSCSRTMNRQLDPHYYKAFGHCLDCRAKFETKMKLEGKWDKYLKNTSNKEIDNMIEEYKAFMVDALNESSDGFVTESGEVEKWIGGINKERAEKAMDETIKYLENLKKD